MIALTRTTVVNTLIVTSVSPLPTVFLAWLFLKQKVALRTWLAIIATFLGILWMFAYGMSEIYIAILIVSVVPVAAAVNLVAIKRARYGVDLIPAVLLGLDFFNLRCLAC